MFIKIINTNFVRSAVEENAINIEYMLYDTHFTTMLNLPISLDAYQSKGEASIIPSGLIDVYSKENENVAANLALFYMTYEKGLNCEQYVTIDKIWTDKYFPHLNFGSKYYECTLNQIKKLKYSNCTVTRKDEIVTIDA